MIVLLLKECVKGYKNLNVVSEDNCVAAKGMLKGKRH
jgi:hypothetical protein